MLDIKKLLAKILNTLYPVGCYYETSDSSFDPNVSIGGTWSLVTSGNPVCITNATNVTGSHKATSANTWEYTGVSFTIPSNRRAIVRVNLGYSSGKPIGVGVHSSSTLSGGGFPYYNIENANGVSYYTQLMGAGTFYVYEKRVTTPNSANSVSVIITNLDFSTGVRKWHRTA